jgi:ribosomal protein S27AE
MRPKSCSAEIMREMAAHPDRWTLDVIAEHERDCSRCGRSRPEVRATVAALVSPDYRDPAPLD